MYRPGNLDSSSMPALVNSLRLEFEKLAQQFAQPSDFITLKTLYAEPGRIFEGMIVKADGTTWNPSGGAGVYCYRGGAWRLLG